MVRRGEPTADDGGEFLAGHAGMGRHHKLRNLFLAAGERLLASAAKFCTKLAVIFNTTVFAGNFEDIPAIAAFLASNSDVVSFASFQLHADAGRGIERGRPCIITPHSAADAICRGIGAELSFGFPGSGHAHCNRYAMALICNGRAYDFYEDQAFLTQMLQATADLSFYRQDAQKAFVTIAAWTLRHPWVIGPGLRWLVRKAWHMRRDLIAAHGKITKISFFIHNFMDARRLERERVEACAFMVATAEGPVSMCLHNARRDDFVSKPIKISTQEGEMFWNPVTGRLQDDPRPSDIPM
jgi:hypothetical protein